MFLISKKNVDVKKTSHMFNLDYFLVSYGHLKVENEGLYRLDANIIRV